MNSATLSPIRQNASRDKDGRSFSQLKPQPGACSIRMCGMASSLWADHVVFNSKAFFLDAWLAKHVPLRRFAAMFMNGVVTLVQLFALAVLCRHL